MNHTRKPLLKYYVYWSVGVAIGKTQRARDQFFTIIRIKLRPSIPKHGYGWRKCGIEDALIMK